MALVTYLQPNCQRKRMIGALSAMKNALIVTIPKAKPTIWLRIAVM
jgi:hypothetical protein